MILCAIPDLLLFSRVQSVAKAKGIPVRNEIGSVEQFCSLLSSTARIAVIDLDRINWDLILLLNSASKHEVTFVAFGSHVNANTLQSARDAGIRHTVPRSKLVDELSRILK